MDDSKLSLYEAGLTDLRQLELVTALAGRIHPTFPVNGIDLIPIIKNDVVLGHSRYINKIGLLWLVHRDSRICLYAGAHLNADTSVPLKGVFHYTATVGFRDGSVYVADGWSSPTGKENVLWKLAETAETRAITRAVALATAQQLSIYGLEAANDEIRTIEHDEASRRAFDPSGSIGNNNGNS